MGAGMSELKSGGTGWRIVVGSLFAFLLSQLVVVSPCGAQTQPQPNFAAAKRDLWTPGEVRFLKRWLMLGPVDGDLATPPSGLIAATPAPGASQSIAGKTLVWQPQFSWTDLIDLPSLLNAKTYRGTAASPETAFAFTTISRDQAGEAVLSIGSDQPLRVWLNGKPVFAERAPRTFLFDQDRVPVHLQKGENRLLVGFVHRTGPWHFALRLLRPGQIVKPVAEITPSLSSGAQGVLNIRTDITPDNAGAPVHVAAVGPGGRILAQRDAARGAAVRLDTGAWPEGPYEIRLTTKSAWGEEAVVHLPGYKGDARPAAEQLEKAAQSAPKGLAGDTVRLLADLVRDRLGENPAAAPDDVWPLVHSALMEYAELQGASEVRPYGFVRLAYTDDVDGSTQFCRAYLPPHYDPRQSWPMIVMLHGFNPPNPPIVQWWSVDKRHDDTADRHDVIFVEPMGRGNSQYLGIGEQDVLRCIHEAKKRFSVDDDRVYLSGESMGGSGTWLIASHHPELFAAAAPFFGGWDYRILPGGGFDNPKADQLPEKYAGEYQSSFVAAENLSHLPLFVTHGDSDQSVPVDFTRFAVTMLQRWNYDIRYEEIPGRGHEDLDLRDRVMSWLLSHRRGPAPHDVHIRAVELDHASAYWARIMAFEAPFQVIEADAEVMKPGLVRLDTKNVAAIDLALPAELRGSAPVRIVWNGRNISASPDAGGVVHLQEPGDTRKPTDKRPGLEGGLSNIFTTPYAVVIGTISREPRMRELCREKGDALAQQWMLWQHVRPRVLRDTEVTPADERKYSLLLVGGADANAVSRRLMPRLPLRVDAKSVSVGGRVFGARDAVAQMIYPSPANPARYVLVVAATSADGMYFWDPTGYWFMPFGYATQMMDWTIRDGRLVNLENGLGQYRTAVASGVFNRHWRQDRSYIFPGDEALREASPLRHPPVGRISVAPDLVKAITGHYLLQQQGVVLDVHGEGDSLVLVAPGGVKNVLMPENEGVFNLGASTTAVTVTRDAEGRVTGLAGNNNGTTWQAKKLD